jgi:hypothetical protein
MIFRSRAYSAAVNALFAEHDLSYIELAPRNPFAAKLKDAVISAMKSGHRRAFDEQHWMHCFNTEERVIQLNLVAFGFMELGMEPLLGGRWEPVYNPFVIRGIEAKLEKAGRHIQWRYPAKLDAFTPQKSIRLRSGKLSLHDWGLADLENDTGSSAAGWPAPPRLREVKTPQEIDVLRKLSNIADSAITEASEQIPTRVRLAVAEELRPDPGPESKNPNLLFGTATTPSIHFISQLPHSETNVPKKVFERAGLTYLYYEKPRTIGEVTAHVRPPYAYPQVAIVVSKDRSPMLIVRIEVSSTGSFLCAIDVAGNRSNAGRCASSTPDSFLEKVVDIVTHIST